MIVSVACHLGLGGLGLYALRTAASPEPLAKPTTPASGDLSLADLRTLAPLSADGLAVEVVQPTVDIDITAGGGEAVARPDLETAGHAGSLGVDRPALNLFPHDDRVAFQSDVASRRDREQVQRSSDAHARTSPDDRRAIREPELGIDWVEGAGRRAEARAYARTDPSRGAERAPDPTANGAGSAVSDPESFLGPLAASTLDSPWPSAGAAERESEHERGSLHASPGRGILARRAGIEHRASAAVARERPWVKAGFDAFAARARGPARDDRRAVQEAAQRVQALMQASTAGGVVTLAGGPGGESAPAAASGAGGVAGEGSKSLPFGGGNGPFPAIDGRDPRLWDYERMVLARLEPLWEHAFPKWAALEGLQGVAIVGVVIQLDGSVTDVRIVRPSGVAEFDTNVRQAVWRASPLPPLPREAGGAPLHWEISFDAMNPAVR